MNKIILIGRISNILELRYTKSEIAVTNFNLAVNRIGEGTDFIPIKVYGKQAENLVQYQGIGSQIAIEGSLRIETYQDSEGNNRKSIYVLAQTVHFLSKKQTAEESNEKTEEIDDNENPFEDFGNSISIDDNFLE